MTDRSSTDDGSPDSPAPGETIDRSSEGDLTVHRLDDETTVQIDAESDFGARMLHEAEEKGETPEEFLNEALRERLGSKNDGQGNASERIDEIESDKPETYHPKQAVTPGELYNARALLSNGEFEEMNRVGAGGSDDPLLEDGASPDRVLVSLDTEIAKGVQRRAHEFDRDPNDLLDAFVRHGNLEYEDALKLRPIYR